MVRYYEELAVGDGIGPMDAIITSDQVKAFVATWQTGAPLARFLSEEAAKRDGLPGAMVPSLMILAQVSRLLTDWSDSLHVKLLDVIYRQPVLHDLSITVHGVVTDKREEDGDGFLDADVYGDSTEFGRHVTGRAIFTLPHRV